MNKMVEKIVERLKKLKVDTKTTESRHHNIMIDICIDIISEEAKAYNDCILVHAQGLDVGIQCAMCTNPMKSDRGCDGGCSVNEDMYKKVLDVIKGQTVDWLKAEREG